MTVSEPWKAHVVRQLRRRDREQHHSFRELVCAYSRLLDRNSETDPILRGGRRGAAGRLKTTAGEETDGSSSVLDERNKYTTWQSVEEQLKVVALAQKLACQVVERQQEVKIKEDILEAQRGRLLQEERHAAAARDARRRLRLGAERLGSENALLKSDYDALLERRSRTERRLHEEDLRGSRLLEDVIARKRQAAARLNLRNDRRSRARDANLQKDLQTAATFEVDVELEPFCLTLPKAKSSSLRKKFADKSQGRPLRSAPDSERSPRILASLRELFERRRGPNALTSEDRDRDPERAVRVPASARVPSRALHVLEAHEEGINTAAFCPGSARLASAGTDRVVKVWHVQAGALRHQSTLDGSTEGLTCVQFDPTGHRILAGSYDKSVLLWHLDRPVAKLTLTGHSRKVTAARFSRHQVVTGSADGTVRTWDLRRAACVRSAEVSSYCSDVVCSENIAISGHFDRQIRLWDSRLSGCVHRLPAHGKVTSLDLSADGRRLLSCCRDDGLRLLDVRRWSEHGAAFRADGFKCASDSTKVAISPDACFAAAGSADGAVYVWNVATGDLETRLADGHSASVGAVCWSSSGEFVASVDKRGRAVLWSDI